MAASSPAEQREQLDKQRRRVDFDTYDVTVDELLRRVQRGRIDIAPIYQRQFRWDSARQSRLVESVLLGIPVPPLFMATNSDADSITSWEVVDGLQRLLTLVNFVGDEETRKAARLAGEPLKLTGLDKLLAFDGSTFSSLPGDIATSLEDRPLKVIVLNDKSDLQVRYDLFERLNTGGVVLTAHEIRQSVYRGEFIDLIKELSREEDYQRLLVLPASRWRDGTPEDYALRFFAFRESYMEFDHSVQDFLTEFTAKAHKQPNSAYRRAAFERTFSFLRTCFPNGLKTRKGMTPVNLFEAVAVGAALALEITPSLEPVVEPSWVSSQALRDLTTGSTNSRPRVTGRIEYCRDRFLRRDA